MILTVIIVGCLLLTAHNLLRIFQRRTARRAAAKVALIFATAATTACGHSLPARPEPVPALCDSACFTPCNTQLPKWAPAVPDDPRAWDTLAPQVIKPAQLQLQQCELRRKSCDMCIQRLRTAGVLL